MTTTIVFDQHPIFLIQPSYRMLTYTHIFAGVLAILLLWFGLTLAFIKPPVRETTSGPNSNLTLSSNTSSKDVPNKGMSLTGIVPNKEQKSQPPSEEQPLPTSVLTYGSNDFIVTINPFSDVAAPVKVSTSPSPALHPVVRRMSMPKHRPSFCIPPSSSNTAAPLPQRAKMLRHGSLADDNTSYLPPPHVPSGKVRLITDDDDKNQSLNCVLPESKASKIDALPSDLQKKSTKFKRVKRRIRALFQRSPKS